MKINPKSRKENIVVQGFEKEMLVYDWNNSDNSSCCGLGTLPTDLPSCGTVEGQATYPGVCAPIP